MGNAALSRRVAKALRDHAGKLVKDVPDLENLLSVSLLNKSVAIKRLDLQERLLENLGVYVPLAISQAWLEDLVLSLQGRVLRLEAKRFIIHGGVRRPEDWEHELQEREKSYEAKAERLAAHEEQVIGLQQQSRTHACFQAYPDLEIDVGDCEVSLWDSSTRARKPFEMAAIASRLVLGKPLELKTVIECSTPIFLHLDLRFSDYRMYCCDYSPRDVQTFSRILDDENIVLGPCKEMQLDIRVASWPGVRAEDQAEIPGFLDPPVCMGRRTPYDFLLPLASLAVRSTHCDFKLSQSQLAHLIRFGRTMGFWYRLAGAKSNIELCESECLQYQERWLQRVRKLRTDPAFSNDDAIIIDFEKRYSEGQVQHQRAIALFSTAYFANADQMECSHLLQSNMVGDSLFNPMFYTTFVLDVTLEDSLIELFLELESDDGRRGDRASLRVEAKDSGSQSCVRYVLHVEETPWSAPVSNQLCISNWCAHFVESSSSSAVLSERVNADCSPALLESASALYMMWDLQAHPDALFCPDQLPTHFHLHCGELTACIQPVIFTNTCNLINGAIELADLQSDLFSQFVAYDTLTSLGRHADAVDKSVRVPRRPQSYLPDVRIAASKPLELLLPRANLWSFKKSECGLKIELQPEIHAAAPGRSRFTSQLDTFDEFTDMSDSLTLTVARLAVWAFEKRDFIGPASYSLTPLLSCCEVGCHYTGQSCIVALVRPLETHLAAADVNLLLGIARDWKPALAELSSTEPASKDSFDSDCEGDGLREIDVLKEEDEEESDDDESRPKSSRLANAPIDPLPLPSEYTFEVRIRLERVSCKLLSGRGEDAMLDIQVNDQCVELKSDRGELVGEYRLQHVRISDTAEHLPIVCFGEDSSSKRAAVQFDGIFRDGERRARLIMRPLWFCVQGQTILRLMALRTAFSEFVDVLEAAAEELDDEAEEEALDEALDPDLEVPQGDLSFVAILLVVHINISLEKFIWFIPCSDDRDKEGLLLTAGLSGNLSRRPHFAIQDLSVVVLRLSECGIEDGDKFQIPTAQGVGADVLHPTRISAGVLFTHDGNQTSGFCVDVNVEPICISLRTSFVHQALDLQKQIKSIMTILDQDERVSSALVSQDASNSPTVEVGPLWLARVSVTISIIRLGFAHAPSDLELVVFSMEDALIVTSTAISMNGDLHSSAGAQFDLKDSRASVHSLPSPSTEASPTAPPKSRYSRSKSSVTAVELVDQVWPFLLSGSIRALSVSACATQAMQLTPVLEPVHVRFSGFGSDRATCSVSWVNLNLSVLIADAFMCLFQHAQQVCDRWRAIQESTEPRLSLAKSRSLRLGDVPKGRTNTSLTTPSSSTPIQALRPTNAGTLCAPSYFSRSTTHSDTFKTDNLIGQGCSVEVFAGGSWIPLEKFATDGSDSLGGSYWLTSDARFQLSLPDKGTTEIQVPTIPHVQAHPLFPEESSRALQKGLRKLNFFRQNPHSYGWVLARQQIHGVPPRREIVLSSLVYLENHTRDVTVAIVPICDCQRDKQREPCYLNPGDCQAVPMLWLIPCSCRKEPPPLYCGLATEIQGPLTTRELQEKKRLGLLTLLVDTNVWSDMYLYKSMVADDYNLTAKALPLFVGEGRRKKKANLCASVYGISQELDASQMSLFFMIAVEPMVQLCNRLLCNLSLLKDGISGRCEDIILAGDDAAILYSSDDIGIEIELPTGHDESKVNTFRLLEPLRMSQIMQSRKRRKDILYFYDSNDRDSPHWEAILRTEIGAELSAKSSKWTQRFKVHQYSPLARRLVIHTRVWFINRRSDCRLFTPSARSSASSYMDDRRRQIYHIPCNALRMLPGQVVDSKGRIRVGLFDHCNNSMNFVPVTDPFKILHGASSSVRVQRDAKKNPLSKSFGYTARPAPMPFYRTLIVDFFRRYTLVNHKQHDLIIQEYGKSDCIRLKVRETMCFDPQGEHFKLAISGLSPGEATDGEEQKFYFDIDIEGRRRHFQIAHRVPAFAVGAFIQPSELEVNYACQDRSSKALEATHGEPMWCITAVDLIVESGAVHVRFSDPEQPDFRIINRTGHDLKVRQVGHDAVLDIPSETSTPFCWFCPDEDNQLAIWEEGSEQEKSRGQEYRIGHVVKHKEYLAIYEKNNGIPPSPASNQDITHSVKSDARNIENFQVNTRVKNGCREVHLVPWCRVVNLLQDDESGRTQVLYVQQTGENNKTRLRHKVYPGDAVLIQPEGEDRHTARLELKSSRDGKGSTLKVSKYLVGKKGYLRLNMEPRSSPELGNSMGTNTIGTTSGKLSPSASTSGKLPPSPSAHASPSMHEWSSRRERSNSGTLSLGGAMSPLSKKGSFSRLRTRSWGGKEAAEHVDVAEVSVRRDKISKFLVVELRQCSTSPYPVANDSKMVCTISPYRDGLQVAGNIGEDDGHQIRLMPGERSFYAPPVWDGKGGCRVTVSAELPFDGCVFLPTVILEDVNLDKPEKHMCAPLVAVVVAGNPCRLLLGDARSRKGTDARKSVRHLMKGIENKWNFRDQIRAHMPALQTPLANMRMPKLTFPNRNDQTNLARRGIHRMKKARRHMKVVTDRVIKLGKHIKRGSNLWKSASSLEEAMPLEEDVSRNSETPASVTPCPDSVGARSRLQTKASLDSLGSTISQRCSMSETILPFQFHPSTPGRSRGHTSVFCIDTRKTAEHVNAMRSLEIHGIGIAMLNSESLLEVAYACVANLNVDHVRKTREDNKRFAANELCLTVDNIQVDVREANGLANCVVLRPLPWAVKEQCNNDSVIDTFVAWPEHEANASKRSGHFEFKKFETTIHPLELYLDTMHLFRLLEWVGAMQKTVTMRMIDTQDLDGSADLGYLALGPAEKLYHINEGNPEDELVGETGVTFDKPGSDYGAPTPLFIRSLRVVCVRCVVSVNFSGWDTAKSQGSEDLVALNVVLKKTLPFDLSNADIRLGHIRPYHWVRNACSCCRRQLVSDIVLHDQYFSQGTSELQEKISEEYVMAFSYQMLQFVGAQQIFFNLPKLSATLFRAGTLAFVAVTRCKPKAFLAALLLVIIGCLESCEGCYNTLAKAASRMSVGAVPDSLRRQPSNLKAAIGGIVGSAPWTAAALCARYQRMTRAVRRSRTMKACCCFPFKAAGRLLLALVSAALILTAKSTQLCLLIALSFANFTCPEYFRSAKKAGPMRRGPQQHHKGVPVQYSKYIAEVLSVAQKCSVNSAAFLAYWRLRPLPNAEGMILAVRGTGFFHIKFAPSVSASPFASLAKIEVVEPIVTPSITWKALGDRWKPPDLVGDVDGGVPALQLRLDTEEDSHERSQNNKPKPLQMHTHAAAMAAYGFVKDFIIEVSGVHG